MSAVYRCDVVVVVVMVMVCVLGFCCFCVFFFCFFGGGLGGVWGRGSQRLGQRHCFSLNGVSE